LALTTAMRSAPEPDGGGQQWRDNDEGGQRQLEVGEQEDHSHAAEGEDVDHRVDEAALEQGGESFDVGGHAGHDAARHLGVVVVEPEPLQMGEDAHPQAEQQALRGAARVARVGPRVAPVEQGDSAEDGGDHPQGMRGVLLHAVVDAEPDERGPGQREERVEHDQRQADGEGLAERTGEAPQ
jgi:hypothetical protein